MSVGLEAVPDCITGQFRRAAQLIETLTGKEAATVWFTHVCVQTELECKPVRGLAPSIMPLPVFSSPGGGGSQLP